MFVTVTPNPSVDRTIAVAALLRGAVLRGGTAHSEPSGKGVNVALALAAHGHPARAVLPVGGPVGDQLTAMLRTVGLEHRAVPIAGQVRTNLSLVEPDGTVTKVNEPGPPLIPAEIESLRTAALHAAVGAGWLAGCGSLPPGGPDDFYARLVAGARGLGCRTAVDTAGAPLREALAAGPDLVTPNRAELAEAVGAGPDELDTLGAALDAARELRARGAAAVLASLGADGALLVDADGALHGTAMVARVVSTVGAGDALLAGFLAGGGRGRRALELALSWAATAVGHPGTLFTADTAAPGTAAELRVRVGEPVDPADRLTDG